MPACFVTGAGTDVGKTFVTANLVRRDPRRAALKPVVSGFDRAQAASSDPGMLLTAMGRDINDAELDRIAPWRFAAPLSPDMAAAHEGRTLDFDALVAFSRGAIAAAAGPLLIEGVGGVMVPLDARHTVLDWMQALALPVLLVAGSYLGTISHSLTALSVLRAHGLHVAALAVNESQGSTVDLGETVATIARLAGRVPVIAIARGAGASDPAFAALEKHIAC